MPRRLRPLPLCRARLRARAHAARLCTALLLLLLPTGASCTYTALTAGARESVAIHGVRNDTLEPGVDALLTDALLREFMHGAALRFAKRRETPDWVIEGAVVELETQNRALSPLAFTLEYELRMRVRLDVTRPSARPSAGQRATDPGAPAPGETPSPARIATTGAENPPLVFVLEESERYLAGADLEVTRSNRTEALRRLAGVLAVRAHDLIYAGALSAARAPGAASP